MVHFYKIERLPPSSYPATPNAILLIAPCISPNSIALAVPIAVLLQPKPTPIPTGFFDAEQFYQQWSKHRTNYTRKITPATVIPVMPP